MQAGMVGRLNQMIQEDHLWLTETLTTALTDLSENGPEIDTQILIRFLQEILLPHVEREECCLYPTADALVKKYAQPTATMCMENRHIEHYVEQLIQAAQKLSAADPAQRLGPKIRLLFLGAQLQAILELHLAKEQQVYLPLFEQYLSEQEQQCIQNMLYAMESPRGTPCDPAI